MNHFVCHWVVVQIAVAVLALSACGGGENQVNAGGLPGSSGSGGGSSGSSGGNSGGASSGTSGADSAGTSGVTAAGVQLLPDETGWVDGMADGNTVKIQGAWYPYGDADGAEKKCLAAGHQLAECSTITTPDPTAMKFENVAGKMCTSGVVAKVLPGADGKPDFSNMWGAGIALDLFASKAETDTPSQKMPYDAMAHGVLGFSFDIDAVPATKLRVEFPTSKTEGGTAGSDYWGAGKNYPPSPVLPGHNVIRWADVVGPTGDVFDPTQILSIQFHIPTNATTGGAYSFCISNLTALTQ